MIISSKLSVNNYTKFAFWLFVQFLEAIENVVMMLVNIHYALNFIKTNQENMSIHMTSCNVSKKGLEWIWHWSFILYKFFTLQIKELLTIPLLMLISFTKVISLAWMRTWCFYWINKIQFETNLVFFYITPFHYLTLVDA